MTTAIAIVARRPALVLEAGAGDGDGASDVAGSAEAAAVEAALALGADVTSDSTAGDGEDACGTGPRYSSVSTTRLFRQSSMAASSVQRSTWPLVPDVVPSPGRQSSARGSSKWPVTRQRVSSPPIPS